ncbi:MAG: hypothetical protein U9Q40_06640, partial [Campylobacterota bacterium]|nr:hypothetical protein [Campylobacterota bacterium]
MNVVIGTVKAVDGQYFAKDSHGNVIELNVGDKITKDMLVYGAEGNSADANIKVGMLSLNEAITLTGVNKQTFDMTLIEDNSVDDLISPKSIEEALRLSADSFDTENMDEEDILDDTEA